tara:strand:- start:2 stop:766 length:765 start_codon:yes stop_codon:yes gene_type:complete
MNITKKKIKVVGLIPTRIGSTRLPAKPLLEIKKIPLIIHTYKRALLSKSLNDLIICCDDKSILACGKKFKANIKMTSPHHQNGTERIAEVYFKSKLKYDLIIDIQGDEPLLSPHHIDEVVNFHKKNLQYDIVLPVLKIKQPDNPNTIKVVVDKNNNALYFSRSKIPFEHKTRAKFFNKHLSIISFTPNALKKFAESKKTYLEKIEDIELLRALELGLKIKIIYLKGDSFSVDVQNDYENAKNYMEKDKFFKLYS